MDNVDQRYLHSMIRNEHEILPDGVIRTKTRGSFS